MLMAGRCCLFFFNTYRQYQPPEPPTNASTVKLLIKAFHKRCNFIASVGVSGLQSVNIEVQPCRITLSSLTCIVVDVVDLHGWLRAVVAKTAVLLQQLQTFIAIIHRAPTVVRTQHCNRWVNRMKRKRPKCAACARGLTSDVQNRYGRGRNR